MTINEYYEINKHGTVIGGQMVAPKISASGLALQWVVDESIGQAVIDHMAVSGIANVRTMVRDGKMAIEAK